MVGKGWERVGDGWERVGDGWEMVGRGREMVREGCAPPRGYTPMYRPRPFMRNMRTVSPGPQNTGGSAGHPQHSSGLRG